MKKLFWAMMCCVAFVSCGNDDDTDPGKDQQEETVYVGIAKVFPNGIFTSTPDYDNVAVDGNNRVTYFTDGSKKIVFDYVQTTRAMSSSISGVIMKIYVDDDLDMTCTFTLNELGFVSHCDEEYSDPGNSADTWDFTYDTNGHMIYMHRSESNESTTLTYDSNGDLTAVKRVDDDESVNTSIKYGSDVNAYSIMLFDELFRVDMDEMCYAYDAGLLGMSTTHLPISCVEKFDSSYHSYTYEWIYSSSNPKKPSMVKINYSSSDGYTDSYKEDFN